MRITTNPPRPDSSLEKTAVATHARSKPTTAMIGPMNRRDMLDILDQANSIDCEDEAADRDSKEEADGGCTFHAARVGIAQHRYVSRSTSERSRDDGGEAEYVIYTAGDTAEDEDRSHAATLS